MGFIAGFFILSADIPIPLGNPDICRPAGSGGLPAGAWRGGGCSLCGVSAGGLFFGEWFLAGR